ncbi:MAG: hypothetical protein WDN29_06885 [Methylovirgula sp.]
MATTSIAIEVAVHHAESSIEARAASFRLVDHLDNALAAQYDLNGLARGLLLSDDKAHFRGLYAAATQIFSNQIADARVEANGDPEMLATLDKFAAAGDTWHRETGDVEMQLGSDPKTVSQALALARTSAGGNAMSDVARPATTHAPAPRKFPRRRQAPKAARSGSSTSRKSLAAFLPCLSPGMPAISWIAASLSRSRF